MKRLLQRIAFVSIATMLLLETVMQLGAVYVWLTHGEASTSGSGHTILCVGDSWTFGVGATDPITQSYPAVLQRILAKELPDQEWHVVNRGTPGQSSRDVLRRLPDQLQKYRPAHVFIVVGQNDEWSRPDPLVLSPDDRPVDENAFRWRWRTARLFAFIAGKLTTEPVEDTPEDSTPIRQTRPLKPNPPSGRPWHREARELENRGLDALADGDRDTGIELLEQAATLFPDDSNPLRYLAQAHRDAGDLEAEQRAIDAIRAAYTHDPTRWHAETLVATLDKAERMTEVSEVVPALAAAHPESGFLWALYARDLFRQGKQGAAELVADKSVELEPSLFLHHWRAKVYVRGSRPEEAVKSILAGFDLTWNEAETEKAIRLINWRVGREQFDAVVSASDLSEEDRTIVAKLADRAYDREGVGSTYATHVSQMVELCRQVGAVPVFGNYPHNHADIAAARGEVAERMSVPLVDVEARWAVFVADKERGEYFAQDGHFNERGYAQMARYFADHLISSDKQRG